MSGKVRYFNPPGVARPAGAYAHVARVRPGELAFIAGQVALGDDGEVIGVDDFEAQFHAIYRQLGGILSSLEASFDDIVELTTYMTRKSDLPAYRAARDGLYGEIFTGTLYPPNTLLFVEALARPEFLLEISAIARIGD